MADFTGADGPLRELALFAGAGGGILGGKLLGWRTVCAVEYDAYAASVLCARQNDGSLEPFPIWDDVRTFRGEPWRGIVDVVSGGLPCQDIAAAGKGVGIDGERSGLWSEMARIIGEIRPRFAFVENSPMLTVRGLGRVLGDLSEMGYDARWGVVSAADAIWLGGDPCMDHERKRLWIAAASADADRAGQVPRRSQPARRKQARELAGVCAQSADADSDGRSQMERENEAASQGPGVERKDLQRGSRRRKSHWWATEPAVGRVAARIPNRVDRIRCLGNAQVPIVAALAWQILTGGDGKDS